MSKTEPVTVSKGPKVRYYVYGICAQRSNVSQALLLKIEEVTVLTSPICPGRNTHPISSEQSDSSQGMGSSSWNAMAQMLSLFHSPFASSRVCVLLYTKSILEQNVVWSYWTTPVLFSHNWKSWHLVSRPQQSASHTTSTFCCELLLWVITAETEKGLPSCFLRFYFFPIS